MKGVRLLGISSRQWLSARWQKSSREPSPIGLSGSDAADFRILPRSRPGFGMPLSVMKTSEGTTCRLSPPTAAVSVSSWRLVRCWSRRGWLPRHRHALRQLIGPRQVMLSAWTCRRFRSLSLSHGRRCMSAAVSPYEVREAVSLRGGGGRSSAQPGGPVWQPRDADLSWLRPGVAPWWSRRAGVGPAHIIGVRAEPSRQARRSASSAQRQRPPMPAHLRPPIIAGSTLIRSERRASGTFVPSSFWT